MLALDVYLIFRSRGDAHLGRVSMPEAEVAGRVISSLGTRTIQVHNRGIAAPYTILIPCIICAVAHHQLTRFRGAV